MKSRIGKKVQNGYLLLMWPKNYQPRGEQDLWLMSRIDERMLQINIELYNCGQEGKGNKEISEI